MGQSGGDRSRGRARILIAGGGVAALEAALALRELAEERVAIELVAPEPHFWYRPLAVAEPFGLGHVQRLELTEFARDCGAQAGIGRVVSVDVEGHAARTAVGAALEYDTLLIATGARCREAVPGALTFRSAADADAFASLLAELGGPVDRIAFVVPGHVTWPLPVYELALLTAAYAAAHELEVAVELVTSEDAPLALFGEEATETAVSLLESRGIEVRTAVRAQAFRDGELELADGSSVQADAAVAAPRLEGVPIEGVPHDAEGFVPVDELGWIEGLPDCYAAGDVTAFPIKQGGLAAQQADAAASAIAAAAGAPVEPEPFRPVLRGLLLTGGVPVYLRTELGPSALRAEIEAAARLWWPPSKIVGRYLAPYLAAHGGELLPAPVHV